MPSTEPEQAASNVTAKRQPAKRKREIPSSRVDSNKSSRTSTPNAYARRTPPRDSEPRPIDNDDNDGDASPPRKLKRPGAGARIGLAEKRAAEAARRKREEEERAQVTGRPNASLVAEHYNAVPERGRDWRRTDSQIKGLRSLNNWIKSTLIQKFSQPEIMPQYGLTVLDMACGKGGDLGKWEKAPIMPALYVGCDIADVSIHQAKDRHAETQRRNNGRHRRQTMQAEFYVKDTFGTSLGEIPIVRQVGFNPNAGPGPNVIQGGMISGGFDVVSMMFALHYSFENEDLARGMLRNVAGALKKGGKFIGVMPNSDVISATVKMLLQAENPSQTPQSKGQSSEKTDEHNDDDDDNWDPEKPSEPSGGANEDDWDPEKPSEPQSVTPNGVESKADEDEDDWDPEKPSEPATNVAPEAAKVQADGTPAQAAPGSTPLDPNQPPLEWGNDIYKIRFDRYQPLTKRPLPRDGVFRPPYGWRYHYLLEEAVNAPEYVVPWEGFRALAEDYGLELMYRKGFKEVFEDESVDKELGMLAERMGVMSRDRTQGRDGLLVSDAEMEAASFYHAFCFYKT
ncbi:mrna cap guanine-n7 methyltransferase [Acrodontium crateriforme]|uniref:mRNA cap guanine-N(7) methyltransferase n=1 Tax=Acrodontium crateriforme TaxID=150365 RepID=A0AAQ3RD57_9PEZI|nr:mrna cap guanine-n7 methyltransferase [Acrodontium crateriforme]